MEERSYKYQLCLVISYKTMTVTIMCGFFLICFEVFLHTHLFLLFYFSVVVVNPKILSLVTEHPDGIILTSPRYL